MSKTNKVIIKKNLISIDTLNQLEEEKYYKTLYNNVLTYRNQFRTHTNNRLKSRLLNTLSNKFERKTIVEDYLAKKNFSILTPSYSMSKNAFMMSQKKFSLPDLRIAGAGIVAGAASLNLIKDLKKSIRKKPKNREKSIYMKSLNILNIRTKVRKIIFQQPEQIKILKKIQIDDNISAWDYM